MWQETKFQMTNDLKWYAAAYMKYTFKGAYIPGGFRLFLGTFKGHALSGLWIWMWILSMAIPSIDWIGSINYDLKYHPKVYFVYPYVWVCLCKDINFLVFTQWVKISVWPLATMIPSIDSIYSLTYDSNYSLAYMLAHPESCLAWLYNLIFHVLFQASPNGSQHKADLLLGNDSAGLKISLSCS